MNELWRVDTLSDGDLSLYFLPGIGGRLWDIVYRGQSLLFQNQDLVGLLPDIQNVHLLPTRSPHFKFPLWGGEKTWVAPDSAWINHAPHATLDSAPYEAHVIDGSCYAMQSAVCPQSQLQIRREIKLESAQQWTVQHTLTNRGTADCTAGIWSVMMLDRPVKIWVQTTASRSAVSVFGDHTGCIATHPSSTVFDCHRPQEFKTGLHNKSGTVIVSVGDTKKPVYLRCQTPQTLSEDLFAHGHNVEVFNSSDYEYCEAEWHSPASIIAPGHSQQFQQAFSVSMTTPSEFGTYADPLLE